MSRKNTIPRTRTITAGDMSLTSITSLVTNIEFLDNIGIEFDITGTPTGTLVVQGSNSHQEDPSQNVINAGVWVDLVTQVITAGVPNPIGVNLNQIPFIYVRAVYTKTSGTGTLNSYLSAKTL